MKQEYKNFGYMLAWVVVATMLLNPTFASQISSNLVKWFVAITSSDVKAENNLVWLDAGWKLPTDVIPAEAATTAWINMYNDHFCIVAQWDSTVEGGTCPTWFWKVDLYMDNPVWGRNRIIINWTATDGWFNSYDSGTGRWPHLVCCVRL